MFRNFISNLRSLLQPENDISQQNNTSIGHTSHLTDHTATSKDTMHNNNTALDANKESSIKSVEEQESKHNDSIISSDGKIEITKELVNDIAEPIIDQLYNIIENSTCSDLDQLFQNTDSTEDTINSAHRENLEPVATSISNESKTNVNEDTLELILREKVMESQDMTKTVDCVLETQTDFAINSIDTDELLDEIIDKNEPPEEFNLHLKEPHNSELQNIDENTKKCLKEFNEVLNEIQNKDEVMIENAEDTIGDFDNIVLVEDFNLDIDPLSLADVQMCEDDNTINISDDDDTVKQNVLDVSPTKRIPTDNSKDNVNTCVPTTENSKNVDSYTIEYVKETCSKSDTIIGPGNNIIPSVLTVDSRETSCNNIIEIDDDDNIISISSEDEPDVRNETSLKYNTQTIKIKLGSKVCNLIKLPTDCRMSLKKRHLQDAKKINVHVKKPIAANAGNVVQKTDLRNFRHKTKKNCESIFIINTIKDDCTQNKSRQETETVSTNSEKNKEITTNLTETSQEPNLINAVVLNETIQKDDTEKAIDNSPKTLNTPTNKEENMETISTKSEELEKMSTKTVITPTNKEENMETNSTKSDKLEKKSTKSGDNDDYGYHSSDFEFITEEEATKEVLTTKNNYRDKNKYKRETRQKRFYATRNRVQNDPYGPRPSQNDPYGPGPSQNDPYGPGPSQNDPYGPGPSQNNPYGPGPSQNDPYGPGPSQNDPYGPGPSQNDPYGPGPSQNDPYGPGPTQNDPYGSGPSNRNIVNEEENYEYIVPEENEVINMFQALPPMPLSEIHFLENKSIRCRVPMLAQYEGVGFDMSLALHGDQHTGQESVPATSSAWNNYYHKNGSDRQEAQETEEKIRDMYQENRRLKDRKLQKRRRRM